MPFGQVLVGPPGSGKTTYCNGMQQYLRAAGRKVCVVNLDPANDVLPYTPDVDISDLVCLEQVMDALHLGPNGGMLYCMEYLAANVDWLEGQLQPFEAGGAYFLFDCPGQAELFTLHGSLKALLGTLTQRWHYRLTAVALVDAHLCTDAAKYISALLLSLSTMLHLEMPAVNVLSKVDLLRQYGTLDFNLDFYTEVQDLRYLVDAMGRGPFSKKFRRLSEQLCEVVQDYGLLSFTPLAIEDKESVAHVLALADKANGCVYASLTPTLTPTAGGDADGAPAVPLPPEMVYGAAHLAADDERWQTYQERYVDGPGAAERMDVPDVEERAAPSGRAPAAPGGAGGAEGAGAGRGGKDPPGGAAAAATAAVPGSLARAKGAEAEGGSEAVRVTGEPG